MLQTGHSLHLIPSNAIWHYFIGHEVDRNFQVLRVSEKKEGPWKVETDGRGLAYVYLGSLWGTKNIYWKLEVSDTFVGFERQILL